MAFKITSAVEPVFEVELPDGSVKKYDPWKVQQDLFDNQRTSKAGQEHYDGIRKAFGFLVESDAGEAFTPTRNQCLSLQAELTEFIDTLPVSKKVSSLAQKLNASSDSPSKS